MEITQDTKTSASLQQVGAIADVMEKFGVKRVAGYSVRRIAKNALTIDGAARVHGAPLAEFLATVRTAVAQQDDTSPEAVQ